MGAGNAEEFAAVADDLCDAVVAIEAIDYNLLRAEQVRTVLDARDALEEMCQEARHNQHAMERNKGGR